MKITVAAVYAALLIVMLDVSAQADFLIVPGKRIGSVVLGMSRQAVHKKLGSPQQERQISNRLSQESWLNGLSKKEQAKEKRKGMFWKWHYLVVYFEGNRVVQAEVNSSRFTTYGGLSTSSSAQDWRKQFHPFHTSKHLYHNSDPGSIPAAKHYLNYEDDVKGGVAWRYGAWGDLAPEPDPSGELEAVIIHLPNHVVVPDPDGGLRFVQTSRERD